LTGIAGDDPAIRQLLETSHGIDTGMTVAEGLAPPPNRGSIRRLPEESVCDPGLMWLVPPPGVEPGTLRCLLKA